MIVDDEKYINIGKEYIQHNYPNIEIIGISVHKFGFGYNICFTTSDWDDLPFIPSEYVKKIEEGKKIKNIKVPFLTKDKLGYSYDIINIEDVDNGVNITHKNNGYVNFIPKEKIIERITDGHNLVGVKIKNNNEYRIT